MSPKLYLQPTEDITDYKDALLALARRPDVETIVPCARRTFTFSQSTDPRSASTSQLPWPSFDTLRTVHDRDRLFAAAREAGVPVPETHSIDEVDDWSGVRREI